MVADPLDDGPRARVAHGEALARQPTEEGSSRSRAVEDRVTDDDVLLGVEVRPHALARTYREDAARKTLAGIVLRVAAQGEGDPGRQPAGKALPGRSLELDHYRVLG